MRRWLIVCLLAACERAGDSQNPLGTGGEPTAGPTGPRAIVDAAVATLPNDAAPIAVADARPVLPDAAVARRARLDSIDVDASRIADLLTADTTSRDQGDMSRRRPTSDLARQIDEVKNGGARVVIGGGGGRAGRGGGDARVGVGGGSIGVGPAGDKIDDSKTPPGRVTIASKRATDQTSLTADIVASKLLAVYLVGIRRCYKNHLRQDASARGRMTLAFQVSESGRVTNPRATGFAAAVDSCVSSMMASWRFPVPKDSDGEATTAGFEIVLQLVPD